MEWLPLRFLDLGAFWRSSLSWKMRTWKLLFTLLVAPFGLASENQFSVYDDVLAFPQYELVFLDSYILLDKAEAQLRRANLLRNVELGIVDEASVQEWKLHPTPEGADVNTLLDTFEHMIKNERPYLCRIPHVERRAQNTTETKPTEAEQEKELARATSRGWELLRDMEGKPCLFYTTGWWSYSFCYNQQVKQFHSLPPGQNGAPLWPPLEDTTTPTYVLGKAEQAPASQGQEASPDVSTHDVVEIQTKAETSYLVQRFDGGTPCDLTGKERKIEIQFHCNPQTTDRIGWIKETATCAYLMVIYTPRLCNDVAFLPPKESSAHPITCQEILRPEEIEDWKLSKANEASQTLIDDRSSTQSVIMVGNIQVGAMREVGKEGRRIERGKVVLTAEEKAETVVIQKDGHVDRLSKAELKKLNLNPEDVEAFTKELKKLAGSKDWKIQRLDEDGQIQLRGVVSSDSDSDAPAAEKKTGDASEQEGEEGSEEVYKEDI